MVPDRGAPVGVAPRGPRAPSPAAGTRVLLVEDNPGDARLVEITLAEEPGGPYQLERAGRISQALTRLERPDLDIVLLDLWLPDSRDWNGLKQIRTKAPKVPVIVLTGSVDPRLLAEAVGNGAAGYHMKGVFPRGVLGRSVRSAIVRHRAEAKLSEGAALSPAIRGELEALEDGAALFEGGKLVYTNPAMRRISGRSEAELSTGPEWLARLRTEGPEEPPGPDVPSTRGHGDFILDRPDGTTVDVEYVSVAFPGPAGRRTIVWLKLAESEEGGPALEEGKPRRTFGPGTTGAPGTPEGMPVLDPKTWRRLAELAGPSGEVLPAMIEAFRVEGKECTDRMLVAAQAGALEPLRLAGHTLRSGAAQVGARDLERFCAEIEATGTNGKVDAASKELVRAARREFERALRALAERQAERG